ncbi:MAG: porin family protein [Candidatus Cryptobacteroides sp.]
MKKLILTALAAAVFAINANAQLGLIGGVNSMSTDIESAIAEYQKIDTYHAGIVYKLNLPLGFSIQPGIVYNIKGQALETQLENLEEYSLNVNMKTGYLQVPVRVGWGFKVAFIEPFVFAEPYAGYAITTESKAEAKTTAEQAALEAAADLMNIKLNTSNSDADKWAGRNRLEYGVALGAGIELFDRLSVSAKYIWDMGSFFTEENGEASVKDQASAAAAAMCSAVKNQKCSGISASLILYF